jgi:hypothetical protein
MPGDSSNEQAPGVELRRGRTADRCRGAWVSGGGPSDIAAADAGRPGANRSAQRDSRLAATAARASAPAGRSGTWVADGGPFATFARGARRHRAGRSATEVPLAACWAFLQDGTSALASGVEIGAVRLSDWRRRSDRGAVDEGDYGDHKPNAVRW